MRKNGRKRKRKSKQKVKSENHENNLFLSRMGAFLFDSAYQIITWVCIAGSFLAMSYFLSKDNMRGTYWSGVSLFIFIVLMLALLGDRHFFQGDKQPASSLKFSAASELALRATRRNMLIWVFLYAQNKKIVASPASELLHVRITNAPTSANLMIDYFEVEIRKSKKEWHPCTRIDVKKFLTFQEIETEAPKGGMSGFEMFLPFDNLENAASVVPSEPQLKDSVRDRNIGPGQTVKGWVFLERPEGFDGETWADIELRIRIKDVNGTWGTAQIAIPEKAKKNTFSDVGFTIGERHDLRNIPRVFYTERNRIQ